MDFDGIDWDDVDWDIDINNEPLHKIDISDDEIRDIENYGIEEYFYNNDYNKPLKLISTIVDENYILNTKDAYKNQHYGMIIEIQRLYGNFDYYVGSAGDELNFFADKEMDDIKYNATIGMLKELKEYCNKYNKNKELHFSGIGFSDKYHEYNSSSDIDKIIVELEKEKELYLMSEEKNNEFGDFDMSKYI